MTLKQTFHNIKTDYLAHSKLMNIKLSFGKFLFLFLSPSIFATTLYRISRWFYLKGLRPIAWLLWQISTYLTGVDIVPTAEIGESFYLGHPVGSVISGKLGSNVMIFGQAAIGGTFSQEDVGGGPGLPMIGDHVIIGIRSCVLGPITIGNYCVIGAMSYVNRPMPENSTALGNPCKIISGTKAHEAIETILNEH